MFSFADASSGGESVESDADVSEGEGKNVEEVDSSITKYTSGNILTISSSLVNVCKGTSFLNISACQPIWKSGTLELYSS